MNIIFYAAIPYFILSMAFEIWHGRKKGTDNYALKDCAASLSMGIGNLIIGAVFAGLKLAALMVAFELAPFHLGIEKTADGLSFTWYAWVAAIVGVDLCMYIGHRTSHRVRMFWANHIIHHSSERYNLGTALRQTWTGNPINIIFYMPLGLLGIHPSLILISFSINLLYQFWVHTEHIDKMPAWFEYIFSTPSHHRVHHSSEERYLDKNYGGIFIIFDRMFGTFKAEDARPVYGLTENIKSYNPLYIGFHEWMTMLRDLYKFKGLKNKVKALLAGPEVVKAIQDEHNLTSAVFAGGEKSGTTQMLQTEPAA